MLKLALPRKIELIFYRNAQSTESVKDWLKALPAAERHVIGQDLMRAQWRWPVGDAAVPGDGAKDCGKCAALCPGVVLHP